MRSTATMIKIPDHSGDFETLERMEWAFSKGELAYFQKVLDEKPSIVLRTHAVCMLADMKSEAAVPLLAGALQEDPSPLVRHEAAFAGLIRDNGLLWEAELLPRSYGANS